MQQAMSPVQRVGIVILMVLLGVYLLLSYLALQETRDAEVVESVQVNLQASVSKGMTALQLPPRQIHPANIINAARVSFPKGTHVDPHFRLTIHRSKREAQYAITDNGDLEVASLKNFTRYHVENGRIVRNAHWSMPLP